MDFEVTYPLETWTRGACSFAVFLNRGVVMNDVLHDFFRLAADACDLL